MDERPITWFAKALDGVNVAYQVVGEGPLDVVFLTGVVIPVNSSGNDGSRRSQRRAGGKSV